MRKKNQKSFKMSEKRKKAKKPKLQILMFQLLRYPNYVTLSWNLDLTVVTFLAEEHGDDCFRNCCPAAGNGRGRYVEPASICVVADVLVDWSIDLLICNWSGDQTNVTIMTSIRDNPWILIYIPIGLFFNDFGLIYWLINRSIDSDSGN